MKEEKHLSVDTENLAMPEIHVHPDKAGEPPESRGEENKKRLEVRYEDLAVPEVRIASEDLG